MKKFYVYIIEDIYTNEFYIGSRGFKGDPLKDKYLGSPYTWKPNIKNLVKKIIKSDFDSMDDAISYERELILNNINNTLNRNYAIPYSRFNRSELITARDKDGKIVSISKNDPLFGIDFFGVTKGLVLVKDKDNNKFLVSTSDERYIKGELIHNNIGLIVGNNHPNYGKIWINNNEKQIFIDIHNLDSYLESGWKVGTLQKNKKTNSSHYDTTWVNNNGINKRIDKNELDVYIKKGWMKGRVGLKKYKTKNDK
jgi:hypothetical protein